MKNKDIKAYQFRLEKDIVERLRDVAQANERSLKGELTIAIQQYLKEQEVVYDR